MAVAATRDSSDPKKLGMAIGLGVLAIVALWWTFFGFGSSTKPTSKSSNRSIAAATPTPARGTNDSNDRNTPPDVSYLGVIPPINLPVAVPEPQRNVFAFYVPPPPPVPKQSITVPSPTPTPPLIIAAVSPANVFARTDDFTLDVTGDKFTPAVRIVVDGRELQTRFISAQQLSATVPAATISGPGSRTVSVKSPDGLLYSNQASITVQAPPVPNYTYIGLLGKHRNIGDTAMLLDKSNKDLLSVQRGDVVGGRFRVTSISDREVQLVDTGLKIKHSIAMSAEGERAAFPQGRPTPKVAAEDDEPQ
jgi:hypothetical protein